MNDLTDSILTTSSVRRVTYQSSPTTPIWANSLSQSDSMVEIKQVFIRGDAARPKVGDSAPHRLLYSKSKVYVHPTAYSRDNIPGFVALVKRDTTNPIYLLSWIPESLLHERGEEEWNKFLRIEESATSDTSSLLDEDSVLVDLPASRPESYAFSVPLSTVYSLIVHPPSLSAWHGSVALNLVSGSTLPTLYFHDDESSSMNQRRGAPPSPVAQAHWGGDDLLSKMRSYTNILRSQLQPSLYLLDPSKADIEAHTTPLFADDAVDAILAQSRGTHSPVPPHLRPQPIRDTTLHRSLPTPSYPPSSPNTVAPASASRMALLQSFSSVTRSARYAAQTILSHPLAKPILPHLPDPVKSLVNANGEWSSWVEKSGTGDYEGARVYLARWARVVAEEGERARIRESANLPDGDNEDETSSLGVFEVLHSTANLPTPKTTRQPKNPVGKEVWGAWFDAEGRGQVREEDMRREIFRRGLTYEIRRQVWPYLLGVLPWKATTEERKDIWDERRAEYRRLKSLWEGKEDVLQSEEVQEEMHRIDVDCRRTDRTHAMFAPQDGDSHGSLSSNYLHQSGAQAPSNAHIERLGEVLLTYNFYDRELGYVQGMSDLCAPIYVVMGGDEEMTFWCFVSVMERMGQNFLRDQSGMKRQLLGLQQLLGVMDPQLHRHLETTDGLNLFFCFRWILIAFKREFSFDEVLRLWDVLWTDYLSNSFTLFVALAVLESHRDVILRYLVEFDEILKYCNDLSMTIELDSTLAQAEVLFLTFAQLVGDLDRRKVEEAHERTEGLRRRGASAGRVGPALPELSPHLRELLVAGGRGLGTGGGAPKPEFPMSV